MPRSHGDQVPAAYVASGQWPHAHLRTDAPVSAHYGQQIARRLAEAMSQAGLSARKLATLSGLDNRTIGRVLLGDVLPDVGTLARLETALKLDLWPAGYHAQVPESEKR